MISQPFMASLIGVKNALGIQKYWPVWLICTLVAGADFLNRFTTAGNLDSVQSIPKNAQRLTEVVALESKQHALYLEKLAQYVQETGSGPLLDAAIEDDRQEGRGYSLIRGDESDYRLLAIFGAGEKFAVVKRITDGLESGQIIEVRVGDVLNKFSVSEILSYTLILRGEDAERVEVNLFSPTQIYEGKQRFKLQ